MKNMCQNNYGTARGVLEVERVIIIEKAAPPGVLKIFRLVNSLGFGGSLNLEGIVNKRVYGTNSESFLDITTHANFCNTN